MKASFTLEPDKFSELEQSVTFTMRVSVWRELAAELRRLDTEKNLRYPLSYFLQSVRTALIRVEDSRTGNIEIENGHMTKQAEES